MAFTLANPNDGPRTWSLTQDDEGYRDYKIVFRVVGESILDGPFAALEAAGLPVPGSIWSFGNDEDEFVWCRNNARVTPVADNESVSQFDVELTFSNRPYKVCQDGPIEDPLLVPIKVSGSYVTYLEEADQDRNGSPILTSSLEKFHGPQVEFDRTRSTVRIEMNVADLQLPLLEAMLNTLNSAELWGFPARCIKFSKASWEKRFTDDCNVYYTWILEFEVFTRPDDPTVALTSADSGFDRDLLDEGTKALSGKYAATGVWQLVNINGVAPDPTNPTHFRKYIDMNNNPSKVVLSKTTLGVPATSEADANYVHVEFYPESDFLVLGIPATL